MKYKVKEIFKSLCCKNYFEVGQVLEIIRQTSKNRLSVNAYDLEMPQIIRGSHNVKRSTFLRCCEKI